MRSLLIASVLLTAGVTSLALPHGDLEPESLCSFLQVDGKPQHVCLEYNQVNSTYEFAVLVNSERLLWQKWDPSKDWALCNRVTSTFWLLHLCGSINIFTRRYELILYKNFQDFIIVEFTFDGKSPTGAEVQAPKPTSTVTPTPTPKPVYDNGACNVNHGDQLCLVFHQYETYVVANYSINDERLLSFRWNYIEDRLHCFKVPGFSNHGLVCASSLNLAGDLAIFVYGHFKESFEYHFSRPAQDMKRASIIPVNAESIDPFAVDQYLKLATEQRRLLH